MKYFLVFLTLAGWISATASPGTPHYRLIEQTGLSAVLEQLPADIRGAAHRHAQRCDTKALVRFPDAKEISRTLLSRFQQQSDSQSIRALVRWYDSETGQLVQKLDKQPIDDQALKLHEPLPGRLAEVARIYRQTDTGRYIADVTVEIEYAGWLLSGCSENANHNTHSDEHRLEQIHGAQIKQEADVLRALFENDTIRTMAFVFSPLSQGQLSEYQQVSHSNQAIYHSLIDALLYAIATETQSTTTALR